VNATPDGAIPDARIWRLITVPNAPGVKLPVGGNFLAATAVPPLPDGGVVLGPQTSFRVSAEGASRNAAVVQEALADGLAERGYRVDPAAELTVHFLGMKVTKSRVPAREVRTMKLEQRPPPGFVLLAPVDLYEVNYRVSLRDREGRPLWQSNNSACNTLDFESKGRLLGWTRAAKEAAGGLPIGSGGLVRLVPDAPPVNFPLKAAARADGTAEVLSGP
jgi:hypothetical protein